MLLKVGCNRWWVLILAFWVLSGCNYGDGQSNAQETSPAAGGRALYSLEGILGVQALLTLDTTNDNFFCVTSYGGTTTGAEGNFTMVVRSEGPFNNVAYDTVMINGQPKNRVAFSGNAATVTVNNNVDSFPGDQPSGEEEQLFDEDTPCTFLAEVVDDPIGGDRWKLTIFGSDLWPDGTTFKNFTGDDITAGTTTGLVAGDITITP